MSLLPIRPTSSIQYQISACFKIYGIRNDEYTVCILYLFIHTPLKENDRRGYFLFSIFLIHSNKTHALSAYCQKEGECEIRF